MNSIKGKYIGNIEDNIDPKDIKRWITVKGRKVPILKGESIQEAIEKRTNLKKTPILGKEKKKESVKKGLTPEEKRKKEIDKQTRGIKKTKELSKREKAIQKLIEEMGYERERAEKEIEKKMGKKEPKKELKKIKVEKVKEKTKKELVSKIQLKKKKKQIASKLENLQELNKKIYKSPILNAIIDTIFNFLETGKFNHSKITSAIKKLKESKKIEKKKKEQLIKQIESIRIEISEMYEKKDITHDFINMDNLNDITLDFSEQQEDFTILHGPITRAGAFEYEKNGHQVIYYKDWENIKEVFRKREYIPLKASTKRDSHHADILGYATNWKPNDKTEQMFADVVLFKDINEVTDLLNPEGGYQVSIGFKDKIEKNIQWIEYIDHLAMSLRNKDTGRCLTANGKSCFAKQKEMNN